MLALGLSACSWLRPALPERELEVLATAYNSVRGQTDASPDTTAFGIRLRPGMKIVAVSRDLEQLGLREGVRVWIDGVDGEWRVGDRMHPRWQRKIDLYMGEDVSAAKRWGKRRVKIR